MAYAKEDYCVLAIAPSSRGFGFAILDGGKRLVDWAGKSVKSNKNDSCMRKIKQLIDRYLPQMIVLPDTFARGSRRAPRIQLLCKEVSEYGAKRKRRVASFSRLQVLKSVLGTDRGTKHDVAEQITKLFEQELGPRLPPKRLPWMSEDHRMDIFDAVALGLLGLQLREKRRKTNAPVVEVQTQKEM
jgi:Holliday junction resolvasome RuvABC endonuclease subunit